MKRILLAGIILTLPAIAHAQSAGLQDAYGTCLGNSHIQASGALTWTGDFARYCPNVVARWNAAQEASIKKADTVAMSDVRRYGQ